MNALHAPGPMDAGVEMSLRIGQRVRHRDHKGQRVTGVVRGLAVESDGRLMTDIVLDAPIVIPKTGAASDRDISLYWQHVPAHELTAFDDRDDLIETLLGALRDLHRITSAMDVELPVGLVDPPSEAEYEAALASAADAIAKATGAAS